MNWERFVSVETAERLVAVLCHSLWQAALLTAAAAIVCRLGRKLSVRSHYLVYAVALGVCAAALPATYWRLEGSTPSVTTESPSAASPAMVDESAPAWSSDLEIRDAPVVATEATDGTERPVIAAGARGTSPATLASDSSWDGALPWVLALYALGVAVMLGRLAAGVAGAERLRRAAAPIVSGPAIRALELVRRRLPLERWPAIAQSEEVVVPAVVGLLRPTILLPLSATTGLTPEELQLVLAHELAHVLRRDVWVSLFQRLVEAILFFNPAVWYLSRRLSALREFCCDEAACSDAAAEAAAVRIGYATALLHMAELARPSLRGKGELLALAATGRTPSEFRRRIARLLGEPIAEPILASRSGLAIVALAAATLAVGVVWGEPSEQADDDIEVTLKSVKELEASEADEAPAQLVERLQKLLPPKTDADRAVANARARTFGLKMVAHISMRQRSWGGEIAESFQPHDGSLASLWTARGKSVDEKMRRDSDSTMTVAWSGRQLLIQSDHAWNVDAATPPGLYTQARYWDGTEGWWSEIRPGARNIYQYAAIDKLMEHLYPAQFPFWEGAGGRLHWCNGVIPLEEYNVAPELTRYQHEGTETVDGVECDVYAGPERSERLWIEKASGLVKATSRNYWGETLPNYFTEVVAEAAGRTFRDSREYSDWLDRQPADAQELLKARSAAAHWPLTRPGNLTVYRDYRELQPSVEFPMRAERIVVHPNNPGKGFKYYRSETEMTDITEEFDIRKLAAAALPREGDAMTDRRAEPAVDYVWSGDESKTQATIDEARSVKVALKKAEDAKNELINSRPINSVDDAIKVLTDGPNTEPTKIWARAIKYLADHREEAFPAVAAALDAEERDHPISKLAFALRAMGDRRAVPALIRALPKTLLPSRSDYGLLLDGQGSDHDELLRFMAQHDLAPGNDGERFTYGRAFREVAMTLEKLTGQNFSEMELNWVHRAESPRPLALQQEQFHRVARRWADWWEANWQTMTDDQEYARVNLPPLAEAATVPPSGESRLTLGPHLRLEDVRSGWIIQSAHESAKRCFVDLDTMREGGWPESLPPIDEIGVESPELLAWARREGFDVMGITFTPAGETEPLYCLKPLGMETWMITSRELRELKQSAADDQLTLESRKVEVMVPRRKISPPLDTAVDGDSFLFVTREGTAGVIRMTAQVPKKDVTLGRPYSSDDDFMPTGFYPGAKVVFGAFQAAARPGDDD